MSDTPRRDAAKIAFGFQAVPNSFLAQARELERENAALQTENAALAKAFDRLGKKLDQQQDDSKRMDWLQKNKWYWNDKRKDLRKAVDKGMNT